MDRKSGETLREFNLRYTSVALGHGWTDRLQKVRLVAYLPSNLQRAFLEWVDLGRLGAGHTMKDVWQKLEAHIASGSLSEYTSLEKAISVCRKKNELLDDYIERFKDLARESRMEEDRQGYYLIKGLGQELGRRRRIYYLV